jgi:endonuclease/exonuclease/phosphatase (EEP) superfamily protein YafD
MTFNIGNGLISPDQLVTMLRASAADLIGLQEVSAGQAEALVRVADLYPYRELRGTGFSGRAVLSRLPITDSEWVDLADGRPDLQTVIDLNGIPLTLIVAHPPPPRPNRRGMIFDAQTVAQIDRLAAIAVAAAPAVLVGDFNLTARNPSYKRLRATGLVDAFFVAGTGPGSTFPLRTGHTRWGRLPLSMLPLPSIARIDYVWHTPDLITQRAWVGGRGGSDHRPVLARLLLRSNPAAAIP